MDLEQKTIKDVYKDLNSGEFLKQVQEDPKMQAQLALMYKMRDELSKKASGLSFSDGMEAVLDEFKNKNEKKGLSTARKSGTRGSSNALNNDLLGDILYEAPKEDKK